MLFTEEDAKRIGERIAAIRLGWIDCLGGLCEDCEGSGIKLYPTSSGWRNRASGQAITPDVCDRCWGSGCDSAPWPDRRGEASARLEAPPTPHTSRTVAVVAELIDERARQFAKFGDQGHLPDANPDILDRTGRARFPKAVAADLEIPTADRGRFLCEFAAGSGRGNFAAILVEEVAEAAGAIGDDAELRRELVQVAAVAVQWIESIDRRNGR